MIDNIKSRKIRFDVIDYLELVDFSSEINQFLENKDDVSDNIEYGQSLLRRANLDTSITDLDQICEMLDSYKNKLEDINSIDHFPILDYINAVNESVIDDKVPPESEADDALKNFIFQMVQIQKLQSKMLDMMPEIMYMGEDFSLFDRQTNKKLYSVTEYTNGKKYESEEDLVRMAYDYMADVLINNQRKLVSKLDFNEEGFFVSNNGEELFEDEEKENILKDVEIWLSMLYNTKENTESINSTSQLEDEENYDIEDSLIDDVSVDQQGIDNETKERMSRLKDTIKDSTNKINKF